MSVKASGTPGQTESVGKAIRLLALFRGAQTPVRIAEASAATGLARSTTHRLLATLQAQEFIRQDRATRAYYPGPALLDLARSLSRDIELREIARAEMADLVRRTGETANLIVLQAGKALFVEGLEGPHVLRVAARVGSAGEPHATAGGKAILAEMSDAQIARLQADGYGHFPGCVAKTQYSFSTDPAARGAPSGHIVNVREVRLAAGAEFIVMVCGDIMTMP